MNMHIASDAEMRPPVEGMWMRSHLLAQAVSDESEGEPTESSRFAWTRGATAVIAFLVGTGGVLTANYVAARDERGYRLQDFGYPQSRTSPESTRMRIRGAAENLARVRGVFKPTVTELASWIGVSRQTIYNWQAGQPIAEQNDERLDQLARAAELLEDRGLADKPSVLRRKLPGGKTLFESIRAGEAADSAAAVLVSMLERESTQQRAIAGRLANRTRKPVDASEIGAPYLGERT
jgi:DNA-binding XRE family transcriptional regulator